MKLRNAQVASMCLFCGGVRILRVEVVDLVPGSSSLLAKKMQYLGRSQYKGQVQLFKLNTEKHADGKRTILSSNTRISLPPCKHPLQVVSE